MQLDVDSQTPQINSSTHDCRRFWQHPEIESKDESRGYLAALAFQLLWRPTTRLTQFLIPLKIIRMSVRNVAISVPHCANIQHLLYVLSVVLQLLVALVVRFFVQILRHYDST